MKRITFAVSMVPIGLTIAACCFGGGTGSFNVTGPTTSVAPGFSPDPMQLTGIGGGPTAASTMSGECRGHVGIIPNHTLDVTAPMTLRIMVNSDTDTTLVVRLADGTILCNDDSDGTNPIVDHAFPAGQHNVYVGSYSAGQSPSYTLGISTNTTIVPSAMAAGAGAVAAPPAGGGAAPAAGGLCGRATECCNAYIAAMPAAAGSTNCGLYASFAGGPAEAGCQSAIDGFRSGLTALGQPVPAACQ